MAVRFEASNNEYYSRSNFGLGSNFTITCWMKLASTRSDYQSAWGYGSGQSNTWILQADSGSSSTGFYNTNFEGEQGPYLVATRNLTLNTWYWFGLSVSGGSWVARSRGLSGSFQSNTGSGADTISGTTTLYLGRSVYGEYLNGSICAVKIWNTALSASELEAEYAQFAPVRTSNLYAYYRLASPSTADNSGNGRTLSGGSGVELDSDPPGIPEGASSMVIHGWGPVPAFRRGA